MTSHRFSWELDEVGALPCRFVHSGTDGDVGAVASLVVSIAAWSLFGLNSHRCRCGSLRLGHSFVAVSASAGAAVRAACQR